MGLRSVVSHSLILLFRESSECAVERDCERQLHLLFDVRVLFCSDVANIIFDWCCTCSDLMACLFYCTFQAEVKEKNKLKRERVTETAQLNSILQ